MAGKGKSIDERNPAACVSYRLRRAARLAAKSFDSALEPADLRNTQFTILGALALEGKKSIGELSETLATDPTTLNRNLEVLRRRGLVEDADTADARVRIVRISKEGRTKYKEALPYWRKAQGKITRQLGRGKWQQIVTELENIEKACKAS